MSPETFVCDVIDSNGYPCGLPAAFQFEDADDARLVFTCHTHRNETLRQFADYTTSGFNYRVLESHP